MYFLKTLLTVFCVLSFFAGMGWYGSSFATQHNELAGTNLSPISFKPSLAIPDQRAIDLLSISPIHKNTYLSKNNEFASRNRTKTLSLPEPDLVATKSERINPGNKPAAAPSKPSLATAQIVPLVNSSKSSDSIWADIAMQFKMNNYAKNPRVQKEIRKILANKKDFTTILNRSAPYIYYIYSQIQQRKMPAELTLIPLVESEYNVNDHTSAGALGLWQLIPSTARSLHVIANGHDGRRDLIASTRGALTFFNDLQKQYKGNWYLTFAAYNCGPGCVSSAVRRAGTTDYFNLRLPIETKLYVPRVLAAAEVIKHAKQYGITLPSIKNMPYLAQQHPTINSKALRSGIKIASSRKSRSNYS